MSCIYRWIAQYSKLGSEYVEKIVPRVGDWIRADEAFIRVNGNMNYLFSTMDDETRFWLIGEMADTKFQRQADKLLVSTVNMIQKTLGHLSQTDFQLMPVHQKECLARIHIIQRMSILEGR